MEDHRVTCDDSQRSPRSKRSQNRESAPDPVRLASRLPAVPFDEPRERFRPAPRETCVLRRVSGPGVLGCSTDATGCRRGGVRAVPQPVHGCERGHDRGRCSSPSKWPTAWRRRILGTTFETRARSSCSGRRWPRRSSGLASRLPDAGLCRIDAVRGGPVSVSSGWALAVNRAARRQLGHNYRSRLTAVPEHEFVKEGLYGRVRHPMYSGATLICTGAAVAIAAPASALWALPARSRWSIGSSLKRRCSTTY